MPIFLDRSLDKLRIKILKSPFWDQDLETVKAIPQRRWNAETKLWEIPWFHLPDLLTRFEERDLLFHDKSIEKLIADYKALQYTIDELPSEKFSVAPTRELTPYQNKWVTISDRKRRLLCAFEQGCGKCLGSLERIRRQYYERLLIVCPKVVAINWRTQCRVVLGQEAIIYQGTKKKREKQLAEIVALEQRLEFPVPGKSVVICTYETLQELNDAMVERRISPFDQIIIDEAHLASSPESKRFQACADLTNKICVSARVQALTGTPMQHRIRDIWGILHILEPLFAGSRDAFINRYEMVTRVIKKRLPVKRNGKQVIGDDGKPKFWEAVIPVSWRPINLEELRQRLSCIMQRVVRADVTDFKDTVETITVDLHPAQRRMYERIRNDLLVEVGETKLDLRTMLQRLGRLLQASEGLFNFDISDTTESAKLEFVRHELDNADGKVIIWSRFQPITAILGEEYKDRGVIYSGEVSDNRKTLAKWAFNGCETEEDRLEYERLRKRLDWPFEPGGAQFFFGTVDMRSSIGMNLHADCHRQIFTSFSWMGNANAQAADRLRRLGQDADEVITQFLVAENTFEEKALSLVLSNYNNTLKALDGEDTLSYKQISQIIDLLRTVVR